MVSVLFSFLYIGITAFAAGFGIKMAVERNFGYSIEDPYSLFFGGLAFYTVYAGYFSLFTGIGWVANLGMWFLSLLVFFYGKKELYSYLKRGMEKTGKGKMIFLFLLSIVFAYGASRGYLHFDTGLYHAQAIRWIEEYGVIPGLANIHCRLGYNSSAFVLTALYSMHFILPRSLHAVSGFMAFLLAAKSLQMMGIFSRKRVRISDFVKLSSFLYVSMIFTEMMSPASDYFAMIFLFFLMIRWVELEEEGCRNIIPYSLLCVLLVVNVTIKLSVAIMVLLVLKPAYVLIREKKIREICLYLLAGTISLLPYLLRNIIISGYLVYPFPGIDLFSFDWKLPLGETRYDSEEIKVYAKGMTDVRLKDLPMTEWFPGWFEGLKTLEKLWIMMSAASILVLLAAAVIILIKKRKALVPMVFLGAVLTAGYLFWQISTPLVRYGYLYILAFPFFVAGLVYQMLPEKGKIKYGLFVLVLTVLLLDKGKNLVQDMVRYSHVDAYLWQQDYGAGRLDTYEVEGITFYIPLDSGQVGYEAFPGVAHERYDFELRGDTIKQGFRRK